MHRQAGTNCTDAKLYFWTIFQFFFYPNGTHPPTSKLFLDFWNFFNFAKPLSADMKDDLDIMSQLYAQGNALARRFHICSDNVKVTIFRYYCSSLYTSQLW